MSQSTRMPMRRERLDPTSCLPFLLFAAVFIFAWFCHLILSSNAAQYCLTTSLSRTTLVSQYQKVYDHLGEPVPESLGPHWRHWWFATTSCFGVTNHGRLALLWLVRQDRATINSGSPPSCDVTFWQWSVASPPRWVGWLVRYLDIYLFFVCDLDHNLSVPRGPGRRQSGPTQLAFRCHVHQEHQPLSTQLKGRFPLRLRKLGWLPYVLSFRTAQTAVSG